MQRPARLGKPPRPCARIRDDLARVRTFRDRLSNMSRAIPLCLTIPGDYGMDVQEFVELTEVQGVE